MLEPRAMAECAKVVIECVRLGGPTALAAIERGPVLAAHLLRDFVAMLPIRGGGCGGYCPRSPP